MSIEDITDPIVCKYLLKVAGRKANVDATGVVVKFLKAEMLDDDQLIIWAEVIPSCLKCRVECVLARTGDEVPKKYQYISTVENNHDLVFHIYAKSDVIKSR